MGDSRLHPVRPAARAVAAPVSDERRPIPMEHLVRLRKLALAAREEAPGWWTAEDIYDDALEEASSLFVAAASPDVVLALLEEIEAKR